MSSSPAFSIQEFTDLVSSALDLDRPLLPPPASFFLSPIMPLDQPTKLTRFKTRASALVSRPLFSEFNKNSSRSLTTPSRSLTDSLPKTPSRPLTDSLSMPLLPFLPKRHPVATESLPSFFDDSGFLDTPTTSLPAKRVSATTRLRLFFSSPPPLRRRDRITSVLPEMDATPRQIAPVPVYNNCQAAKHLSVQTATSTSASRDASIDSTEILSWRGTHINHQANSIFSHDDFPPSKKPRSRLGLGLKLKSLSLLNLKAQALSPPPPLPPHPYSQARASHRLTSASSSSSSSTPTSRSFLTPSDSPVSPTSATWRTLDLDDEDPDPFHRSPVFTPEPQFVRASMPPSPVSPMSPSTSVQRALPPLPDGAPLDRTSSSSPRRRERKRSLPPSSYVAPQLLPPKSSSNPQAHNPALKQKKPKHLPLPLNLAHSPDRPYSPFPLPLTAASPVSVSSVLSPFTTREETEVGSPDGSNSSGSTITPPTSPLPNTPSFLGFSDSSASVPGSPSDESHRSKRTLDEDLADLLLDAGEYVEGLGLGLELGIDVDEPAEDESAWDSSCDDIVPLNVSLGMTGIKEEDWPMPPKTTSLQSIRLSTSPSTYPISSAFSSPSISPSSHTSLNDQQAAALSQLLAHKPKPPPPPPSSSMSPARPSTGESHTRSAYYTVHSRAGSDVSAASMYSARTHTSGDTAGETYHPRTNTDADFDDDGISVKVTLGGTDLGLFDAHRTLARLPPFIVLCDPAERFIVRARARASGSGTGQGGWDALLRFCDAYAGTGVTSDEGEKNETCVLRVELAVEEEQEGVCMTLSLVQGQWSGSGRGSRLGASSTLTFGLPLPTTVGEIVAFARKGSLGDVDDVSSTP